MVSHGTWIYLTHLQVVVGLLEKNGKHKVKVSFINCKKPQLDTFFVLSDLGIKIIRKCIGSPPVRNLQGECTHEAASNFCQSRAG